MDSIAVGIRVRPLLARENASNRKWMVQGSTIIAPTAPGGAGFEFDHVFGEGETTERIHEAITRPIVHSVMEGINGTVFAYGQTASGKTFTMMGTDEQPGIIPLSIKEMFDYIEEHEQREFIVRISYLEIYKEGIVDLLQSTITDLKIREDRNNNVSVHGLMEYMVTNIEEVSRVICVGNVNRTTGETNMNERSSRSHAVLGIGVESRVKDGDGTVNVSSLNLVDLAGSERLNATGAVGKRAQEGIAINLSLFTLKQVISKLSEGSTSGHIPYRDSKLTHILKPSLGGNAKTAIICAVTPAEGYETELTLTFANCARKVKNRPIVNKVLGGEKALKKKLKAIERENEELKEKLSSGSNLPEESRRELERQITQKEARQSELEARIRSLEQFIIKSSNAVAGTGATCTATTTKSGRRRTICPASLARAMGSPLMNREVLPRRQQQLSSVQEALDVTSTPEITCSVTKRKTKVHFSSSSSSSPPPSSNLSFQTVFESNDFEKELDRVQTGQPALNFVPIHVRDLERRQTVFQRPTFVLDMPASMSESGVWSSGKWTEPLSPELRPSVVDAAVQTDEEQVGRATTQDGTKLERSVLVSKDMEVGLNSSVRCACYHSNGQCTLQNELEELQEFHSLERETDKEAATELEAHLKKEQEHSCSLQAHVDNLQKKLADREMASSAQEEYLTELCQKSKVTTQRLQGMEEACKTLERETSEHKEERMRWEEERRETHSHIFQLKEQLLTLETELQALPPTKKQCKEALPTSEGEGRSEEQRKEIATLRQKLEEAELARKQEMEHFQNSYQLKVEEVRRAQEQVCFLQEQVEEGVRLATPTQPHPLDCEESQRLKEELQEMERIVEERNCRVVSLTEEVSKLQRQLACLSEEVSSYKQVISSKEGQLQEARDAQQLLDMQREIADKDTVLEELTNQVAMMEENLERCQNIVTCSEDYQAQIVDMKSAWEAERTVLQSKLKEKETTTEELTNQVANLKEENLEHCQNIVTCSEDCQAQIVEMESAWEEERRAMQSQLKEKETMTEELTNQVAKMKEENLEYCQNIVTCSEDYQAQIMDMESAWDEERAVLQSQLKEKETMTDELTNQFAKLKEENLEHCQNIVTCSEDYQAQIVDMESAWEEERRALQSQVTRLKQAPPPPCPVAMAEAETKISRLMKQNEQLKAEVQAHTTYRPSPMIELACAGSGAVSSVALYHYRGESERLVEENRLKEELRRTEERVIQESQERTRYREERNIYRAKYQDLKDKETRPSSVPSEKPPAVKQPQTWSTSVATSLAPPPVNSLLVPSLQPHRPPLRPSLPPHRPFLPPQRPPLQPHCPSLPPQHPPLPLHHPSGPPQRPSIFSLPPPHPQAATEAAQKALSLSNKDPPSVSQPQPQQHRAPPTVPQPQPQPQQHRAPPSVPPPQPQQHRAPPSVPQPQPQQHRAPPSVPQSQPQQHSVPPSVPQPQLQPQQHRAPPSVPQPQPQQHRAPLEKHSLSGCVEGHENVPPHQLKPGKGGEGEELFDDVMSESMWNATLIPTKPERKRRGSGRGRGGAGGRIAQNKCPQQ